MSSVAGLFTIVLVSAGGFFFLAGVVGLLRFPDAYTRLHALTKADNLGVGLVIIGLLPQVDSLQLALKLLVIWFLILLASAVCSQLIGRAIRRGETGNAAPTDPAGVSG